MFLKKKQKKINLKRLMGSNKKVKGRNLKKTVSLIHGFTLSLDVLLSVVTI